jgi:hypothetical protein
MFQLKVKQHHIQELKREDLEPLYQLSQYLTGGVGGGAATKKRKTSGGINSSVKGNLGEGMVRYDIEHLIPDAEIVDRSHEHHTCDLSVTYHGYKFFIEVKCYQNTVPTAEVVKFRSHCDLQYDDYDIFIFLSLTSGIAKIPTAQSEKIRDSKSKTMLLFPNVLSLISTKGNQQPKLFPGFTAWPFLTAYLMLQNQKQEKKETKENDNVLASCQQVMGKLQSFLAQIHTLEASLHAQYNKTLQAQTQSFAQCEKLVHELKLQFIKSIEPLSIVDPQNPHNL